MNKETDRKYWFKAKQYGWGWYPARIEGFAAMLLYILAAFFTAWTLGNSGDSVPMAVALVVETVLFVALCWKKGEKPRWRWGNHERGDGR